MFSFEYATHNLTPEQVASVPAGAHTMLTPEQVIQAVHPGAGSVRVYAYLTPADGQPHGELVKLSSLYYVEKYAGRIGFAWASGVTIADLIGRA